MFPVAVDVTCHPNSRPETAFVGHALARNVQAGAVVRAGAHNGQASSEVHTVPEAERLERGQALVVVHGQCAVEVFVAAIAEVAISGVWAHGDNALLVQFAYGRCDALFVLAT